MKYTLSLLVAVASLVVGAAENLILNGRFEKDQEDLPPFWTCDSKFVTWSLNGGPGGIPCMKFVCPGDAKKPGEVSLRQYGLTLVSNELYRISCQVRTRSFKCKSHGAVAINHGWYKTAGLSQFPENSEWHLVTRDVKMVPSANGEYSVAVYAIKFSGELEVADFQLLPLSEGAVAGSKCSKAGEVALRPRLVPWDVLTHEIPADTRAISFRFYGRLPEGDFGDYDVVSLCGGKRQTVALASGINRFTVPAGAADKGTIDLSIVRRATGRAIWQRGFNYTVVPKPPVATEERRLNNLVFELANRQISAPGCEWNFSVAHRCWLFVKLDRPASACLDGTTIIDDATPRGETFREVAAGAHTLRVAAEQDIRLIVRRIPEIFNYCPTVNSYVRENGDYDWAFMEKYVLPAVTTLNGGNIPEAEREGVRRRGYKWLANLGTTKLVDEADMKKRIEKAAGMNLPQYDGVTCDEQFFGQPDVLDSYTRGFLASANYDSERLVYSWIVGKPGLQGLDQDYMATSLNCSRGRGRLLFEAYCRTKNTEAEARDYLDDYVTDTYRRYVAAYPLAAAGSGVIFGNFNQIPILSLTHHPEVDYKYYLDMQLHLLATHPDFRTLTCTGYWGSYYADEELHRWSFALLRHYCVEGATEMLSKKYGYAYIPGHLENGDFRGTLAPWQPEGQVSLGEHVGFGGRSQNRWGGNGHLGDTYAVLAAGANGEAAVSQRVKGLTAGRKYVFQFAVADAKDVKASKVDPRRIPAKSEVTGGDVDAARSWVYVDRRPRGRYAKNNGVARINLHHVVFTAKAVEAVVRIATDGAKAGEQIVVNCVSLNPYIEAQ